MNAEQIAQRLFNTVRNTIARHDLTTQLAAYQALVDELEREMGRLEDESCAEDETFGQDDNGYSGDDGEGG